MDPFLTALSGELADTWNTLLVVPGLLYVSVTAIAPIGGHDHPADIGRLGDRLDALARNPAAHSAGTVVLGAAFVPAASAADGLLAGYLAGGVERLWLGEWPALLRRIAGALTRRRARRWREAQQPYEDAVRRADHRDEELPAPSASGGSWHGTPPTETVVLNDAHNRSGYVPPRWPTGWAIASPRSTSGC